MSRREEAHFTNLPKVQMLRSRFRDGYSIKTSLNAGDLIPLGKAFEVLPGDTIKFTTSSLLRMTTLIAPVMGELFFDTFHFFVPFRLVWEHYKQFLGENDKTPWVSDETYSIPQIESPENGWSVGTIADYFGVPTGIGNISISALMFRSYSLIVKDWFYDENNQTPPDVLVDDATITGSNGTDYVTDIIKGGMPFVVGKFHDKFTSCLPAPQKGPSVELPLGNDATVYATGNENVPFMSYEQAKKYNNSDSIAGPLHFSLSNSGQPATNHLVGVDSLGYNQMSSGTFVSQGGVYVDNLHADLSSATATTINDLRLCFATQRLLERMARGGTRYFEILASQWGVIAPQGLIQRTEYLGGSRTRVNITSVVQTSSSDNTSPQGNVAAFSCSTNKHRDFFKSFSEPGYIISLGCVRYKHSYNQGIPKSYMRRDKFDFYNQAFAYIGEQPIFNYEIYMQGTDADNEVFGYNEAWVDYRVNDDMITGMMRTTYAQSLDFWHLGDNYDSLPTLSADFIKEDKTNVDRVLAVSSAQTHQFVLDFYYDIDAIRPMPLYSVPGLLDHF